MTGEKWRMFCAIEPPVEVRERVLQHVRALRDKLQDKRANWAHEQNLHITLKFIGDVELHRIESLVRASQRVAARATPFEVTINNTGVFPPRGNPRVLWLGLAIPNGHLNRLQSDLESECALEGFEPEQRAFNPHLTLARMRSPHGAREIGDAHLARAFKPVSFQVSELLIIRSELRPEGSRYTTVGRCQMEVGG